MKHELQINNYVLFEGEIWQVAELADTAAHLRKDGLLTRAHYRHISPIPLTEELLVKCGGIKLEHKMFDCYNVNGIQLILRGGWFEYVHDIHIKSLHQFQNFYFFTKQQELTIEI